MSCPTVVSTGALGANTLIFEGRGVFRGVNVLAGTVAVYDGVDATGTLLYQGDSEFVFSDTGIRFKNGLFLDAVTGTGEAVVYWGA